MTEVNKVHQADLLFLPHNKVYQNTYKYTLNKIDIASRYKASRPLKTKKASGVAGMFKDIYKKGPLKYPKELHVDNGTEFKSGVLKLMKKVVSATTKYHHNFTAFISVSTRLLQSSCSRIRTHKSCRTLQKTQKSG